MGVTAFTPWRRFPAVKKQNNGVNKFNSGVVGMRGGADLA
jgi:hypothetical protein